MDLVLLKIYFRDLFEGRKGSLLPGRCFPSALWWWICLWCSALLNFVALLYAWKWSRCTVTMHTHCGLGRTISWSSCPDQCLLVTGAELAPALGAAWTLPAGCDRAWDHFLCLHFILQQLMGTGVGVPRSRKAHVGLTRCHVWHELLTSMFWGLWAASCSREGRSQGPVPALTGEWAGLPSNSDLTARLEYHDKNIYTLNAQWCFLARELVKAEDGRWFADGRHCGDRLGLLPASLRTYSPLASSLRFAICFYHFLFFLILRLLLAV